jgi:hypothetical protein
MANAARTFFLLWPGVGGDGGWVSQPQGNPGLDSLSGTVRPKVGSEMLAGCLGWSRLRGGGGQLTVLKGMKALAVGQPVSKACRLPITLFFRAFRVVFMSESPQCWWG